MKKQIKSLISGSPADRLAGLQPILDIAEDKSVLDIGAHKGFVSYHFALAGAREIHAFDKYEFGMQMTKGLLEEFPIASNVRTYDFAAGPLPDELGLLPSYDIVLYLGVHHHFQRVATSEALDALVDQLLMLAGEHFLVRTSDDYLRQLAPQIKRRGFELHYEDDSNPNVSPLAAYRRI